MRIVNTLEIENAVEKLFIEACYTLPPSICKRIRECKSNEGNELARSILQKLSENLSASAEINVPVCQDTGMAVVFIEIGQGVCLEGKPLERAVNDGVARAYINGYLRKSIVADPVFDRKNTCDNTPAVIHTKIVEGETIKIVAAPKGFGSENMSKTKMFTPSATREDIIDFVVDVVKTAGGNPCPPMVIGVGIGGDFEMCAYLSKKALCRDIDIPNRDENYRLMEADILKKVNELDIGPQGFGGNTTALGVNIEQYPTHIAGLPVAVNIGCHITRHKSIII